MLDALLISNHLRITYRVNSILYHLKRLPILRRILPAGLYDAGWPKALALIPAISWEVLSIFLWKIVYLLALFVPVVAALSESGRAAAGPAFFHIFFFLTLAGTLLKNSLFLTDNNTYYAVFLMGMDARRYALSDYFYYLIKTAIGFAGVLALGYLLLPGLELSPWLILILPLFVCGAKLTVSALNLVRFRRHGKLLDGRDAPKLTAALLVLGLLLAYGLPALGHPLPGAVLTALCAACIVAAVPAASYLLRSDDYRRVYLAHPYTLADTSVQKMTQQSYQEKLELNETQSSSKSGCAYLNELFVKRHRKLLLRTAQRTALIAGAVLLAAGIACRVFPDLAPGINQLLTTKLQYFLFVMYFINRGQSITQILFYNCDHSLLAYRFFRRPRVILDLFRSRLLTITTINLIPSGVIALGLALLLWVSGGTAQPVNYLVLPVSILAMSVFFSVHYLVLYYLLQPYTAGLESKNPTYSILAGLTYAVCYFATQIRMDTSLLFFGAILILFCLLYAAVALVLAYRLAPKTFRLHL